MGNIFDISPKNKYKWPKAYERCSISLVIMEIQTKTTVRCHLTQTRMAIKK